eukprot:s10223_g1.t1
MASLLTDSEAVLRERAQRVGVPPAAIERLIAQHITTLAKLAFAPGQPGEQPTDERLKALIQIGADEPSLGALAAIRHLVFEAQTVMINQTKTKTMIENKEDTVKEVPPAERRERIKQQALRLQGLALRGNLECSYASYDLCTKLQVDNVVSYLAPSKFTTRTSELKLEKPKKELDIQASQVVLRDKAADQSCDVNTSLNLHLALQRRALAMDLVGLATYSKVQTYNDFLMGHLHEDVTPGCRPTTIQQVLLADCAAWLRLAELTPDGVRKLPNGSLPLDALWPDLELEHKVVSHLLPQHASGGAKRPHATDADSASSPPKKLRPSSKGKGKGKGKAPKEPANCPEELRGLMSFTKEAQLLHGWTARHYPEIFQAYLRSATDAWYLDI